MRHTIAVLTAAACLLVAAAALASSWKVVKKKSVSGGVVFTGITATIKKPGKIAVENINGSGKAELSCTGPHHIRIIKKFGSGIHQVANASGDPSCYTVATIGGEGKLTVEILTAP